MNAVQEYNREMQQSVKIEKTYKKEYVKLNIFLFILIHIGAVYGFTIKHEALWPTVFYTKLISAFTAMAVTGGAHRYYAHRSYKANKIVEVFWVATISMTHQNSVYKWVREHRLHHKYTDTDADPHNSLRGFFFSHIGWLMIRKHPEVKEKGKTLEMDDLKANKLLMFQNRYYYPIVIIWGIITPCLIACYLWGEQFKIAFFYLTLYRFVFSLNCVLGINSFAHLYGTKPYDDNIGPVESPLMKYIGFGEGFHNYHHTFAWDYRTSEFSSDIRNPTTMLIDFFALCGWVTDRQTVPKELVDRRIKRTGTQRDEEPEINKWFFKYLPEKFVVTFQRYLVMALFICILS